MAVTALPRPRTTAASATPTVPTAVLVLALITPALDLLRMAQPMTAMPQISLLAAGVAGLVLLGVWARVPRASWLAAAAVSACAGAALRLVGADIAPALSLLTVVALGTGGAFASSRQPAEAWIG